MQDLKTTSKRIWMETFMAAAIIGASAQFFSMTENNAQLLAVDCSVSGSSCNHAAGASNGELCCCDITK